MILVNLPVVVLILGAGFPRGTYHQIDDDVHRDQIRYFVLMAEHGTEETFAGRCNNSRRSVVVVYPACHGLVERGYHCDRKNMIRNV